MTLALTAATGLVTALAVPAFAATSTSAAAPAAATNTVQTATRFATTSAMPPSVTHLSGGAVALSEDGKLQRFAAISRSPRPTLVRTAQGNTTLAGPNAASATSWLPSVTSTPVSGATPNAIVGVEGLNEYDNQKYGAGSLEPPDQGLCAGSGHILELINQTVQTFTSNGAPEHTPVYLNDFFKEPATSFTTDPSCVYDAGTNRFFADQLTLEEDAKGALTGRTWVDLAVSATSNPNGGWRIYRIYTTDDGSNGTPSHSGCPCLGDYPHLATDANGVYLTTNEYPFSAAPGVFGNNFNGAQVYALGKTAVVSGAATTRLVHFQNVRVPATSGPLLPGFTLIAAQSAGTGYDRAGNGTINFVSSFAADEARPNDFTGHGDQLGLWWISNTASLNTASPSLALQVRVLTVGSYGIPPLSNQKAGPTPLKDCLTVNCRNLGADPYAPEQEGVLDSSDTRVMTSYYAGGKVYAALDTALVVGGNVQAGFEWFSLAAAQTTSTVARQGYVGVAGHNVIYPAIATDTTGKGYLGVTLSGNNYYPSAAYGIWDGGFGGTTYVAAAGAAPEDGFCEYLYFNCAQTPTPQIRPRWGDYGYAAWDGSRFYVANEYIAHSCSFVYFNNDTTCGGTRTFYGNFSTHIEILRPPAS